jgi:hypothetical protein
MFSLIVASNMFRLYALVLLSSSLATYGFQATSNNCNNIKDSLPALLDTKILAATATEVHNYSVPSLSPYLPPDAATTISFCNLTFAISHGTDIVWEYIWLPLEGWNGRFVVGGGGGYAAGDLSQLPPFVAQGYAAGTSDGGLTLNNTINPASGLWVLEKPGRWNSDLMLNFAYRTIHDLATIGKLVVNAYYGQPADYSYYLGCSTGGRQGYSSAHFYPNDFDGIVATAPAIYTTRYSVGAIWPTVVLTNIATPPNCVLDYYQKQIIRACDELDGLADNIITDPTNCRFDTNSVVGTIIPCDDTGADVTISASYATVVSKILEGGRSVDGRFAWYGIPAGASFRFQANTETVNGTTVVASAGVAGNYVSLFVFEAPDYPLLNMSFTDFDLAYNMSVAKLSSLFPFDDPDLHAFQKGGKKMITWHGQADSAIPPQGTIRFREGLEDSHGGRDAVNDFQRVFLAPGAEHCVSGVGPAPASNVLSVLASWVENGTAPDTIYASTLVENGTTISRDLCLWPKLPYYNGQGDPSLASSFHCA